MCLSLMEEKWDIAIVLDACRHDIFREVYRDYLPTGKLETRLGASDTFEWLHSTFDVNSRGLDNIVYVSAHPGINSKGVPWGCFNAAEKFYKVYDAWFSGWDWKIGSSLPSEVAKIAVKAINDYPDKKVIIHFVQPHFPYRKAPCPSTYSDLRGAKRNPKLAIMLESICRRLISLSDANFSRFRTAYWSVKKILNLNFLEDLNEIYWRDYTVADLKHFYKDNLEWVLDSVGKIVEEFKHAYIVVTSDHGEAFGENGEFFHLYRTKNPVVRKVPFWRNKA